MGTTNRDDDSSLLLLFLLFLLDTTNNKNTQHYNACVFLLSLNTSSLATNIYNVNIGSVAITTTTTNNKRGEKEPSSSSAYSKESVLHASLCVLMKLRQRKE